MAEKASSAVLQTGQGVFDMMLETAGAILGVVLVGTRKVLR
jgi:hypothetical protein